MSKLVTLTGRKPATSYDTDFECFDIETHGMIGAFVGGAASKGMDILLFHELGELVTYVLGCKKAFAHNGGGFDFSHVLQKLVDMGLDTMYDIDPIASGTRVIALRFYKVDAQGKRLSKKPDSVWLDSFAQIPTSLEKLTAAYAPHYKKLSGTIKWAEGEVWTWENPKHVEYLKMDVLGLKMALLKFNQQMLETFGIETKYSSAGNALRAFQVSLYEKSQREGVNIAYFRINRRAEDWCRKGYYGGFVYPGHRAQPYFNVIKMDHKAGYGKRMRDEKYPYGNPIYGSWEGGKSFQGIWQIEITAPDDQIIAKVPCRNEKGMLYYLPAGKTAMTYMTTEAVKFFQEHGYGVNVKGGYYFLQSEYIFRDFLLKCEEYEYRGGVYKEVAKLCRNALSGKFGTKLTSEHMFVCHDEASLPDGVRMVIDQRTKKPLPDLYLLEEEVNEAYLQPHWVAHITWFQRLALYTQYYKIGEENVLYSDTDSIVCEEKFEKLFDCGEKYGQFDIEDAYDIFLSLGPKHYYYGKSLTSEPVYGAKTKGIRWSAIKKKPADERAYMTVQGFDDDKPVLIPRDDIIQERLAGKRDDVTFLFESPTSANAMLKAFGRTVVGKERSRTLSTNASSIWNVLEDNRIVAVIP